MQFTRRLFGSCWRDTADPEAVEVDPAALALRLLLFDHLVIESARLHEVRHLVQLFGYDATVELLRSGAVTLLCDCTTIVNIGHAPPMRRGKRTLPLGSYSFTTVRSPSRKEYVSGCLKTLDSVPGVQKRAAQALKRIAVSAMVNPPDDAAFPSLEALKHDISHNQQLLDTSMRRALQIEARIDAGQAPITATVHWIDEHDFRIETNIQRIWSLDGETTHRVGQRAVLGIAGANLGIEKMKAYKAVSGILEEDAPMLNAKLDFFLKDIAPQALEREATRVLTIAGVPLVAESSAQRPFDLKRLLEIRQTPECQAFRTWLSSTAAMNDKEVREHVDSWRAHLGDFVRSGPGKALRLLVGAAAGLVPGVGVVAGLAAGAIDSYILERMLPEAAPIAFISRLYPSLFREPK